MAGKRFTTRLAALTSIVAGLLTLFALTLALASPAEAYVYWVRGLSIGRANLDGTGVNQRFIPIGLPTAYGGLAVDEAHVYWGITSGEVFGGPDEIGRANLDGTGVDKKTRGA